MYFGLSEEQMFFQDNIKKFLSEQLSIDSIRNISNGDKKLKMEIHKGLLNLGINSLMVPEEYGGLGLDLLFGAAVSEGLGYGVATSPFIGSYVMAPLIINYGGNEEQKEAYLPKITSNDLTFAVGLSAYTGARDNATIHINKNKITGRSLFVYDSTYATHFLIADANGLIGVIDGSSKGVSKIHLKTIDKTRDLIEVCLDKADVNILENTTNIDVINKVVDAGRIMLAADTLGCAQSMIDKSVDYAKERQQFGRPIGSFQAVKHMCAEMCSDLEPCYSLVWHAAHSYSNFSDESRIMACHAKSHLSEVGKVIAKKSVEVHGGMGFTDLLGLHYWFKRIGLNRQLLGSPETTREVAAKIQLS